MNSANDLVQVIPQAADYVRILPEIVLTIFGMIVMVLDPLMDERRSQRTLGTIALVGSLAALASNVVPVAISRPGLLEHGARGQFQRLLPFSGCGRNRGCNPDFVRVHASATDSRGRILRVSLVRRGRHELDVVGGGTGSDLYRAGNLVDLHLHSGWISTARRHQQ